MQNGDNRYSINYIYSVKSLQRTLTLFFLFFINSLSAQYVKEFCETEAQIIGFDLSKCDGCWGWMIQFEETAEDEHKLVDPNEHFRNIGIGLKEFESLNYPIKVKLEFKQAESGFGNRIVVTCAKLDE